MSHDSWLFGRLFQSWRLLVSWTSDVEGRYHWSFTGGSNPAPGAWFRGLTELGPWHLQMLIGTGPIVPLFVGSNSRDFFIPLIMWVACLLLDSPVALLLNVALLIWVCLRLRGCVKSGVVAASSQMLAVEVQSTLNQLKRFSNISVCSFRLTVMVWAKFSLDICNQVSAEMTLCCPKKHQIGSDLKNQLDARADWMALSGHSHC